MELLAIIAVLVFIIQYLVTGSFWDSWQTAWLIILVPTLLVLLGMIVHYIISSIYPEPPEEIDPAWHDIFKNNDTEQRKKGKDLYL